MLSRTPLCSWRHAVCSKKKIRRYLDDSYDGKGIARVVAGFVTGGCGAGLVFSRKQRAGEPV